MHDTRARQCAAQSHQGSKISASLRAVLHDSVGVDLPVTGRKLPLFGTRKAQETFTAKSRFPGSRQVSVVAQLAGSAHSCRPLRVSPQGPMQSEHSARLECSPAGCEQPAEDLGRRSEMSFIISSHSSGSACSSRTARLRTFYLPENSCLSEFRFDAPRRGSCSSCSSSSSRASSIR